MTLPVPFFCWLLSAYLYYFTYFVLTTYTDILHMVDQVRGKDVLNTITVVTTASQSQNLLVFLKNTWTWSSDIQTMHIDKIRKEMRINKVVEINPGSRTTS